MYVCVCMEKMTEGKMDPERGALESSLADTGLEAPEQQCITYNNIIWINRVRLPNLLVVS